MSVISIPRRLQFAGAGIAFFAVSLAAADEGLIPIWEPVTISEPGSYVVTRDFASTGGPAIVIAATAVTSIAIDLNGFTISSSGSTAPTIDVNASINVVIRNGNLHAYDGPALRFTDPAAGSSTTIVVEDVNITSVSSSVPAVEVATLTHTDLLFRRASIETSGVGLTVDAQGSPTRVALEHLDVVGGLLGGIAISGILGDVTIRRCNVHGVTGTGIRVDQASATDYAAKFTIENNVISSVEAGIIVLANPSSPSVRSTVEILDNTISWFNLFQPAGNDPGIHVESSTSRIERNRLYSGSGAADGIVAIGGTSTITGNIVHFVGGHGVSVDGDGGRITGNISTGNGGDGLRVDGQAHSIVGNQLSGNLGYGLFLTLDGGNAYFDNVLLNNVTGIVGGPSNTINTDGDGNVIYQFR